MFYVKQIRTLKLLRENTNMTGSKLYSLTLTKGQQNNFFANSLLTTILGKSRVKFEYNGDVINKGNTTSTHSLYMIKS